MKNIIRLEELAMLGLCVFFLSRFGVPWWCYIILFLGPDISMLGYLAGNQTGAICYNLFHHKGVAVAVFAAGILLPEPSLQITGILLFGHSSMDRMFGYGLKTGEGFKHTHLGIIGKK